MNILFVCSRNKWRSRTAETIFSNNGQHLVRSAGTEKSAQVSVTEGLVKWADLIFVMEEKHEERLVEHFGNAVSKKKIVVLGIPDEYRYMDPELTEILQLSVQPYLEEL